ncbi:MAG: tetratricopeptide repeat protein, partial [Chloroflexota bacterium]
SNHRFNMPQEVAQTLVEETEGWITGLLLSLQTVWSDVSDRLRFAQASEAGLYSYLAEQVFEQQPAVIQDFLLRTSLLEEFDAGLCQAVFGAPDYSTGETWFDLIELVSQSNLFVLPVGDQGDWLRYHHLFRDFLQDRISKKQPERRVGILNRLGGIYTEREAWEKAYDIYEKMGDSDALADLIEKAGVSLLNDSRFTFLNQWIEALPIYALNARPNLLSLYGYALAMTGKAIQGLNMLNQSLVLKAPDRPQALTWRAGIHRLLSQHQEALSDINEALSMVNQVGTPVTWAESLRVKGQVLMDIGQVNEAIDCLQRAANTFETCRDQQNRARTFFELGLIYIYNGGYNKATYFYQESLAFWRETDNSLRLAESLNSIAYIYAQQGEYEQSISALEEALIHTRQTSHHRFEIFVLASIGDLYRDLQASDASEEAYTQAYEIADRINDRFLKLYNCLARVSLARSKGDLIAADHFLQIAKDTVQTVQSDYEKGLYDLEAGRLDLAKGDAEAAVGRLESCTHCFSEGGHQVEMIRSCTALAQAYQIADKTSLVIETIERAISVTLGLDSQHPMTMACVEIKPLLKSYKKDKRIGQKVSELLRKVDDFEKTIPDLRRQFRYYRPVVP